MGILAAVWKSNIGVLIQFFQFSIVEVGKKPEQEIAPVVFTFVICNFHSWLLPVLA
jgi:hypothetical protein